MILLYLLLDISLLKQLSFMQWKRNNTICVVIWNLKRVWSGTFSPSHICHIFEIPSRRRPPLEHGFQSSQGPLPCKYVLCKWEPTWLPTDTDTFISPAVWVAVPQRPRPRVLEGRLRSWKGGVSLARGQSTADLSPSAARRQAPLQGPARTKAAPGSPVVGRERSGPGFPVSHDPSPAVLPRTRWLTSEPSRPDKWCNAMFIPIPFFPSV